MTRTPVEPTGARTAVASGRAAGLRPRRSGFTLLYLALLVLLPLGALFAARRATLVPGAASGAAVAGAARARRVPADASAPSVVGALINVVLRPARRLGAGALPLPRPRASSTRWSTCRSRCRPRWPASRSPPLYAPNGWLGRSSSRSASRSPSRPLGIVIALTFVGLPFVVRTRAAGARRTRPRGRGGRGEPRREPLRRRSAA